VRKRRAALIALIALAAGGCGQLHGSGTSTTGAVQGPQGSQGVDPAAALHPHPQAIEPVAGAAGSAAAAPSQPPAAVSVGPSSGSLAQPESLAQVRAELAASGETASVNTATLTSNGLAVAPIDAPPVVQEVIAAGNQIAHLPYVYGGGHITYEDTGYDCSGSISFVFDAAHLLTGSVVSGQLERWGDPGPGKWITVFANAGHTFMYVAGLRFDTVALAETGSRWSARPADEANLRTFVIRHPPGL
jgi:hypothetical protein